MQVPEPKSIITATFTAPADDYPLRIFGDNSQPSRNYSHVYVDNKEVPLNSSTTTVNAGQHTVKYELNKETATSDFMFCGCSNLVSITIPNNIPFKLNGLRIFRNTSSLSSIIFEGTINEWEELINGYTPDNDSFTGCSASVVHCTDGDVNI